MGWGEPFKPKTDAPTRETARMTPDQWIADTPEGMGCLDAAAQTAFQRTLDANPQYQEMKLTWGALPPDVREQYREDIRPLLAAILGRPPFKALVP